MSRCNCLDTKSIESSIRPNIIDTYYRGVYDTATSIAANNFTQLLKFLFSSYVFILKKDRPSLRLYNCAG